MNSVKELSSGKSRMFRYVLRLGRRPSQVRLLCRGAGVFCIVPIVREGYRISSAMNVCRKGMDDVLNVEAAGGTLVMDWTHMEHTANRKAAWNQRSVNGRRPKGNTNRIKVIRN